MCFVFYGLHDTTLQICIISLYECFAYDITVVVKINLFQCQCQCQCQRVQIAAVNIQRQYVGKSFEETEHFELYYYIIIINLKQCIYMLLTLFSQRKTIIFLAQIVTNMSVFFLQPWYNDALNFLIILILRFFQSL